MTGFIAVVDAVTRMLGKVVWLVAEDWPRLLKIEAAQWAADAVQAAGGWLVRLVTAGLGW